MYLRWAWREIRNNKKFAILFIFNLAIGLAGFLCLDAFKEALSKATRENSKNFLSADVAITARRVIQENEVRAIKDILQNDGELSRTLEFFAMAVSPSGSRLVQVKAVEQNYPFYGSLELSAGVTVGGVDPKSIHNNQEVWAYPELLRQLNLEQGGSIKLGQSEYKISDVVVEDSTQTFRLAALAPKLYVDLNSIEATGLVQYGTTLTDAYLIKIKDDAKQAELVRKLKESLTDVAIRVTTYQEAGEESARALSYLSDYLGLVSLVALFLAALGTAYLYRSYLFSKLKSIAIYNSLGLSRSASRRVYLWQLVILGALSAVLGVVFSAIALPALTSILNQISPVQIQAMISWKTVAIGLLIGSFTTLIVGAPFLRSISKLSVAQLFSEESSFLNQSNTLWWQFLPALFFYWVLAVMQSNSLKIGSLFVFMFLLSLCVLLIISWLVLKLPLANIFGRSWYMRQSMLSITRKKTQSLSAIAAVGLGALLINLMPQLKSGLGEELLSPKNATVPALFLFDIQDDQVDQLQTYLTDNSVPLQYISPLVRGRILKVNDENFERSTETQFATREEEQAARFRNRGVNVSFRPYLADSERLTHGEFVGETWDSTSGKLPALSVEYNYASDLNFKLNDVLTFDIQGVEIQGQITSFRRVKWNSFQPNFFILMQPGVLEDAPKTYLAAVPKMPVEQSDKLQDDLSTQFGNVSVINVHRLVDKIFEISDKMSWSLELMAWLSFLAGFVVLGSMAHHQALSRRWDINMYKILGGQREHNLKLVLYEFIFLGLLAATLGAALSILTGFGLSWVIFDGSFKWQLGTAFLTIAGVVIVSCLVAVAVFWGVLREKPIVLLQSGRQGSS